MASRPRPDCLRLPSLPPNQLRQLCLICLCCWAFPFLLTEPADAIDLAQSRVSPPARTHQEALSQLVDRAGFQLEAVVEGFNPLPAYCLSFEKVHFANADERQVAIREINDYFDSIDMSWYDVWSRAEQWMLLTLSNLESELSHYSLMFNMTVQGVDIHLLPFPYVQVYLAPAGPSTPVTGQLSSDIELLVDEYGFSVLGMREGISIIGPDIQMFLRKTRVLSPAESDRVRKRIDVYFKRHPRKLSFRYLLDYIFFNSLISVNSGAMALGRVEDLSLLDILINIWPIPKVTTRMGHGQPAAEGYRPPPCG